MKDKIPGIPGSCGIDGGLGKVSYLSQELFVSSQEGTFPLHLTAKINLIQSPIIISINDELLVLTSRKMLPTILDQHTHTVFQCTEENLHALFLTLKEVLANYIFYEKS